MRELFSKLVRLHPIAASEDGSQDLLAYTRRLYHATRLIPGSPPLEIPPGGPRPAAHIERAQGEYLTLIGSTGSGKEHVQEQYLQAIGAAADPGSVPFWRALLGHGFGRDRFKKPREEHALTALALLVATRRDPAALTLLLEGCRRENPLTRGVAAQLAVLAHPAPGHGIEEADDVEPTEWPAYRPPPEVVATVLEVAQDRSFEARFLARRALEWIDHEVPRDAPDGVFSFEVCPKNAPSVRRVIEIHSSQTLDDLGAAILDSINWDHDHLCGFYFGKDDSFILPPPHFDFDRSELEVAIGDLGLVAGGKFIYLYDFGDRNRFEVRLVSIAKSGAPLTRLPRVAKREGKSPKQYRGW